MKLELKHLAPYFPYGLKGISKEENLGFEIIKGYSFYGNNNILCLQTNVDDIDAEVFLPILKPISDLSLLVIEEFEKYDGKRNGKANEEIINLFCEENGVDEIIENIDLKSLPYECIDFIFINHYDFFGLIEKGLAISIPLSQSIKSPSNS